MNVHIDPSESFTIFDLNILCPTDRFVGKVRTHVWMSMMYIFPLIDINMINEVVLGSIQNKQPFLNLEVVVLLFTWPPVHEVCPNH